MTALITHTACLDHEMGRRHVERPARLAALLDHFRETGLLADLDVVEAVEASSEDIGRVHDAAYTERLDAIEAQAGDGIAWLDPDTGVGAGSLRAGRLAAGAAAQGVELACQGVEKRVFCAVRPPGHHAEAAAAMGFCFYNGIAVAAAHALARDDVDRVAVLDFDVHHGNGTVAAFESEPRALVCSSFQFPHYPYRRQDVKRENIVNTPLPAGTTGAEFRAAVERDWLPALDAHRPHLVLVSAGFDAHAADPLGDLLLDEADFAWVTRLCAAAADEHAEGRLVSVLEGGYDLTALARSAEAHVLALASG